MSSVCNVTLLGAPQGLFLRMATLSLLCRTTSSTESENDQWTLDSMEVSRADNMMENAPRCHVLRYLSRGSIELSTRKIISVLDIVRGFRKAGIVERLFDERIM